jgi:hypothetical protein
MNVLKSRPFVALVASAVTAVVVGGVAYAVTTTDHAVAHRRQRLDSRLFQPQSVGRVTTGLR